MHPMEILAINSEPHGGCSRVSFGVLAGAACTTRTAWKRRRCDYAASCGGRTGAILSTELLFILPLMCCLFFAMLEFGLLWSANGQVKLASRIGCRVATLPGSDADEIKRAVLKTLDRPGLRESCEIVVEGGSVTGDTVTVEVCVPMSCAAPDLLEIFGFSLDNRTLIGRTVMRKE